MTALALERAGRHQQAIAFRKQVIELDPDIPGRWLALAQDQQAIGLLDDARKSLDEAETKVKVYLAENPEQAKRFGQSRFKEQVARLRELVEPGN